MNLNQFNKKIKDYKIGGYFLIKLKDIEQGTKNGAGEWILKINGIKEESIIDALLLFYRCDIVLYQELDYTNWTYIQDNNYIEIDISLINDIKSLQMCDLKKILGESLYDEYLIRVIL